MFGRGDQYRPSKGEYVSVRSVLPLHIHSVAKDLSFRIQRCKEVQRLTFEDPHSGCAELGYKKEGVTSQPSSSFSYTCTIIITFNRWHLLQNTQQYAPRSHILRFRSEPCQKRPQTRSNYRHTVSGNILPLQVPPEGSCQYSIKTKRRCATTIIEFLRLTKPLPRVLCSTGIS